MFPRRLFPARPFAPRLFPGAATFAGVPYAPRLFPARPFAPRLFPGHPLTTAAPTANQFHAVRLAYRDLERQREEEAIALALLLLG